MFKSTEKNKHNKELLMSSVVFTVIIFYIALCLSVAVKTEHRSIFLILKSNFLVYLNPIYMFQHFSVNSLAVPAYITFLCSAIMIAVYIQGRTRNHDMEGVEQGSAEWTVNVAEDPYYKENEKKTKSKKTGRKKNAVHKHLPSPNESEYAAEYRRTMMSEEYTDNIMFDNTYGLSMNQRMTRSNLHMLVIGGSGAGKTRFFVKPNILQMNSSYIITDPSGELYRDMGDMLRNNNYDVRVFNVFDPNMSMQYNPLSYIRKDSDITDLVTALIKNTGEASGDSKFFDDATKQLLIAIIAFLIHYCPKEEQDFAHVMKLVVAANPNPSNNSREETSDLDKIFEQVKKVDPNGLAAKTYKSFSSAKGKTLQSILSSTTTRLTVFNYEEIERLTCADTISLSTLGDEKTALFIITPPSDQGFNFLVAMMYSQLFSTLYYHTTFECRYLLSDDKYIKRPFQTKEAAEYVKSLLEKQYANKDQELIRYEFDDMIKKYTMYDAENNKVLLQELRPETVERFKNNPQEFKVIQNTSEEAGSPFHVRMLMDEFANINEIPSFVEVLSTIRKYNVSVVIILQSLSQLKKRYEKDYEAIIDNCDTFIFLGSKGQETTEYVSKMLGTKTITVRNASVSTGGKTSTNYSYNQQKRELLLPNELVMLPKSEQVVILKAVNPFRLKKFVLEDHPNFYQCADGGGKKLIINDELNLEKSIAEYNEKHGIVTDSHLSQDEINSQAQQTVNRWLDPVTSRNENTTADDYDDIDSFQF